MSFAPVTPVSIERAKRIAKRLRAAYPRHPLARCQATTAHLFGQQDWHALENAVKRGAPSGAFDEALEEEQLLARLAAQRDILCEELGDTDPRANYARPSSIPDDPEAYDFYYRQCAGTWALWYSAELLAELEPTAREMPARVQYDRFFGIADTEHLERLPRALGAWWDRTVPRQCEVGAALRDFELDANRISTLLRFGWYWGALCYHHPRVIDLRVGMGVSYLVADRIGVIRALQSEELVTAVSRLSPARTEEERYEDLVSAVDRPHRLGTQELFDVLPRYDFASLFEAQPMAFVENGVHAMEMLFDLG